MVHNYKRINSFTLKAIGFVLLLIQFPIQASDYDGQSPYRLIFLNHRDTNLPFNPNLDVLKISGDEKKSEELEQKILGSVAQGLLPMSGLLGSNLASPTNDFFSGLSSMAAQFSKALNQIVAERQERSPVEASLYLIPYQDQARNLFYSSEKISMSPDQVTNFLLASRSSKKFEATVTEQIRELQKNRADGANPVFLLGIKSSVLLNHPSCGTRESCLVIRALLALKPTGAQGIPFEKENEQVKFERIVIPGSVQNMACAKLVFTLGLSPTAQATSEKALALDVEFGEFDSFSNDDFNLKESGRQNMTPGMEGKAKNFVPVTFSFSKLSFDLERQKVEGLNVLTSVGFVSRRGRLPLGGFKIKTVDTQFQNEINNTIAEERKTLVEGAENAAEEQLSFSPLLKEAIGIILGRVK